MKNCVQLRITFLWYCGIIYVFVIFFTKVVECGQNCVLCVYELLSNGKRVNEKL